MAKFKVGDRVRRIGAPCHVPVGSTGTIVETNVPSDWSDCIYHRVEWDGGVAADVIATKESALAPLTPPAEDTWAADKVRELVKPKPMDVERETKTPAPIAMEWDFLSARPLGDVCR